jgi:CheY-like chemotaxis protein
VSDPAPESTPLKVLLVDGDERVCESLVGLLQIGQRCVVVAGANEPAQALELISRHRPDVVVLDPRLPEVSGGRILVAAIREQWPSTRVVVMGSSNVLEQDGLGGLADAFVRKTFRPRELVDAIVSAVSRPAS